MLNPCFRLLFREPSLPPFPPSLSLPPLAQHTLKPCLRNEEHSTDPMLVAAAVPSGSGLGALGFNSGTGFQVEGSGFKSYILQRPNHNLRPNSFCNELGPTLLHKPYPWVLKLWFLILNNMKPELASQNLKSRMGPMKPLNLKPLSPDPGLTMAGMVWRLRSSSPEKASWEAMMHLT